MFWSSFLGIFSGDLLYGREEVSRERETVKINLKSDGRGACFSLIFIYKNLEVLEEEEEGCSDIITGLYGFYFMKYERTN